MPDAIAATKFRLHRSEILRKKGEHRYSRYNVCVGGGGCSYDRKHEEIEGIPGIIRWEEHTYDREYVMTGITDGENKSREYLSHIHYFICHV